MIRSLTCWQCKNMGETDSYKPKRCKCQINDKWIALEYGRDCKKFEYRQWHNEKAPDGVPIKNRQPLDYRTEKQWEECGRKVIDPAAGVDMYATRHNMKTKFRYYLIEDTIEL